MTWTVPFSSETALWMTRSMIGVWAMKTGRSQTTLSAAATATIGQCRRHEKPLGRSLFFRDVGEEPGSGN